MNRAKELPLWGLYALLAYMPFHVFLTQSLSLITGGLSVWKVAKDVVIIGLSALVTLLVWKKGLYSNTRFNLFAGLTALYLLIHIVLYVVLRGTSLDVATLAAVYNIRPFLLLLIGMGVVLLFGKKIKIQTVIKLVLIVSTIVAALGVIQYFLPTDTLIHFGYSEARGVKPGFLIDNKADLPRIMSTIREPNSLGAFLVVPILVLTRLFFGGRRKLLVTGLLLLHGLALLLTFSRSAWLAMIISEVVLLGLLYGETAKRFVQKHAVWVGLLVVLLIGGAYVLRDQYFVQNTLFHSDENTTSQADSNEKHLSSVEQGLRSIAENPQGYGPGTAGPVSMHTDKPFITENYYIQIAYETGLLGLIIFITLSVFVFMELLKVYTWQAKVLLAAFVGYVACNLFLHTWANEAVATQWWLLAGLLIGHKNTKVMAYDKQGNKK